jgi:hypothetical protein
MKNIMRVAALISLVVPAVVSLHAQVEGPHPTKDIVQPKILTKNELFSQDHLLDVVAVEQVFGGYAYFNDTQNGPGMASLFTDDGVVHFVRNHGGKFELTNGEGCRLTGHKDIATFYGFNRTPIWGHGPEDYNGFAFPGNSHHAVTTRIVKISDDGKTAMLTGILYWGISTSNSNRRADPDGKGPRIGTSGVYRVFFRKTPSDGWLISEIYLAGDSAPAPPATPDATPTATRRNSNCDLGGPIPRPKD